MNNKPTIFFLMLFVFYGFIISCKPGKVESDDKNETGETTEKKESFPYLGNQEISSLYALAEKVDMIFYELPISINQDDATSAKNSVLYISPAPANRNSFCKAAGRISWLSAGAIVREADIYLDSLCYYFVFMENNQQVAANAMSETGINFYKSVIKQVQERTQ